MISQIVIGTDGSETADKAVEQAIELASRFEAKLVVVSAYKPVSTAKQREAAGVDLPGDIRHGVGPRDAVNLILAEVTEKAAAAGVTVQPVAAEGDAVDAILDTAEKLKADLIVVGNKGMAGARRMLGSVPNNISHSAHCSVLIVNTA